MFCPFIQAIFINLPQIILGSIAMKRLEKLELAAILKLFALPAASKVFGYNASFDVTRLHATIATRPAWHIASKVSYGIQDSMKRRIILECLYRGTFYLCVSVKLHRL